MLRVLLLSNAHVRKSSCYTSNQTSSGLQNKNSYYSVSISTVICMAIVVYHRLKSWYLCLLFNNYVIAFGSALLFAKTTEPYVATEKSASSQTL